MRSKVIDTLMVLFGIVFFLCWGFIIGLNLFSFENGTYYAIATFFIVSFVLCIFRKKLKGKATKLLEQKTKMLFLIATTIIIGLLLISWSQLQVDFSWDYKDVFVLAYQKATGQELERIHYLARYPNNNMIFLWITALCKVVLVFDPQASIETCNSVAAAFDCVLIFISIVSLYFTSRSVYGEKIAMISYLINACCLPLFNYSVICYTDTIGLFFSNVFLSLYFLYKSKQNKTKYIFLFLTMVVAGVAYCMKATLIIPIIAVFLYESLSMFRDKKKLVVIGIWIILCGGTFAVTQKTLSHEMKQRVKISKKLKNKFEFPMEHWVMMALNGNGGYNQDDVVYTANFKTLAKRKKGDREMIIQRIQEKKVPGLAKHIFYYKWRHTWANSAFYCDTILGYFPKKNTIWNDIVTVQGKKHFIYVYLTNIWWLFVLFAIAASIWKTLKKRELMQVSLFQITIFGIIMFMSIWECTSRYLYAFIPVFSLCAAFGTQNISDSKEQ